MNKKQKQLRGYYDFPLPDGKTKTLHFSMNFIINLEDLTEMDLVRWSDEINKKKDNVTEQWNTMVDIVYAAMWADDQEKGNEPDYNIYTVRDWVWEAQRNDERVMKEIVETMEASLYKATELEKK